jgi:HSP20 family molecular chaperone IbpA
MFEDPQDMYRDMDDLFDHLFAQMSDLPKRKSRVFGYSDILEREGESSMEPGLPHDELRAGSEPCVEVHCIDNEVKVITELPGVTKDILYLTMKGDKLFIDADTGTLQYHTSAILPPVDPDPVQVSLKNGVLEATYIVSPKIPDNER